VNSVENYADHQNIISSYIYVNVWCQENIQKIKIRFKTVKHDKDKKRRNVVTSTVLTSSRGAQQSRHDVSRVCCSAPAPADVYRQLERGIDNELSWMNFTVFLLRKFVLPFSQCEECVLWNYVAREGLFCGGRTSAFPDNCPLGQTPPMTYVPPDKRPLRI